MRFSRFTLLLILACLSCVRLTAQVGDGSTPEYGELSEAVGLTRLYVRADDPKAREIIIKELEKSKLGFQIVGEEDNAQAAIRYGSGGGMVAYNSSVQVGAMAFIVRGKEFAPNKHNPRFLWSKENTRQWTSGISFNRHPATNLVREFIKAYKKMLKKSNP